MRKMQSVVEPAAPPSAEAKSEAQLIIEAKQRKREEEDMEELQALEEKRRAEREREEEELRRLKEKQAERKKAREEEERRLEEQKQLAEEQRRKDEDARRQKAEDEKQRKKEEAERKKAAAAASASGGRNFVIDKERSGESGVDKFMNISKAKTEMSLNAGELQDLRQKTINDRVKPLSVSELDHNGLKSKAEDLWKTIIKLETTNYDLGERFKRQEYDLKELNERQRQISHKKHLAQGLDPEAASSRYPPKVQLASKYERRVDRRTFEERKNLFEQNGVDDKPKELVKPLAKKREDWIKPKETKSHRETPADDFENEHAENDEMEKNSVVHVDDESFEQQKVNSQNSQEHDQDDWTEPDLAEEAQENHIAVASNSRKSSGIVSQTESERDINDENVNEDDLFAGKEDYTALATTTEA
ncbi:troponin T, skeletal muscle-like [Paramacrobiotus metropolitanus]|uniref:troponin T, skeletal muscle-like n=1 Tax=Paramacrobiotus metropolitanus TaxID=2943436 RepID=UPI002445AD4C|nr:troponin T, skeletal muscle-like [Paramacrobiotus metropolitanus]